MNNRPKPIEISSVVTKVMEQLSHRQPQDEQRLLIILEKNIAKNVFKHIKLAGIREHCLTIYVDSPAWLYQLNLKRQKIVEELKKEFSEIEKVYFKIGKVT